MAKKYFKKPSPGKKKLMVALFTVLGVGLLGALYYVYSHGYLSNTAASAGSVKTFTIDGFKFTIWKVKRPTSLQGTVLYRYRIEGISDTCKIQSVRSFTKPSDVSIYDGDADTTSVKGKEEGYNDESVAYLVFKLVEKNPCKEIGIDKSTGVIGRKVKVDKRGTFVAGANSVVRASVTYAGNPMKVSSNNENRSSTLRFVNSGYTLISTKKVDSKKKSESWSYTVKGSYPGCYTPSVVALKDSKTGSFTGTYILYMTKYENRKELIGCDTRKPLSLTGVVDVGGIDQRTSKLVNQRFHVRYLHIDNLKSLEEPVAKPVAKKPSGTLTSKGVVLTYDYRGNNLWGYSVKGCFISAVRPLVKSIATENAQVVAGESITLSVICDDVSGKSSKSGTFKGSESAKISLSVSGEMLPEPAPTPKLPLK